jgi:soluble lytic murein transglycosylase-like protein
MSGIDRVLQRINSIEQRFGKSQIAKNNEFNQIFNDAINNSLTTSISSKTATPAEVTNIINSSARKYGLDPKLIAAVAKNESNFDPNAVSSAGAVGIMQLMPETAKALGVHNLYDPQENVDGGAKYLKELLTTFHGDVTKAVAAYNAGPQAVMNHNGIPPYKETQAYVGKVLQQYRQNQ